MTEKDFWENLNGDFEVEGRIIGGCIDCLGDLIGTQFDNTVKFIEKYIRTRIFDMRIFKDNMEVIINTIDTAKLPAYKRLLTEEYWKIADDQFEKIIEEVLEDVKEGRISPIEIVKIFAYFSYFSKKNLIEYDIRSIKSTFLNGINIASLTASYCENVEDELDRISVNEVGTDMDDVIKYFNEVNEKLKDKMYIEKAEEIFKHIPMKMEVFYDKFAKECMNTPIFKYYDVFQLFQRISCASNEDIVTIKEMLLDRAKKYKIQLEPEVKNIKKLKQIIDDYVTGKEPTIKIVMLEELSKELEKIIDLYKPSFLVKKED